MKKKSVTNILKKILREFGKKVTVERVMRDVFPDNKDTLEDYAPLRMNNEGRDGSGDLIEPFYSRFTYFKKKAEGKEADFVTLRDTGAFHKAFTGKLQKDGVLLENLDSKVAKLTRKYGDDILKLTDAEKEDYRDRIKEDVVNWFKQ